MQTATQAQADLDAAIQQLALWGNDGAAWIASHTVVARLGAALSWVVGDIAGNAVSNALGDTAGGKLLSDVASGRRMRVFRTTGSFIRAKLRR